MRFPKVSTKLEEDSYRMLSLYSYFIFIMLNFSQEMQIHVKKIKIFLITKY